LFHSSLKNEFDSAKNGPVKFVESSITEQLDCLTVLKFGIRLHGALRITVGCRTPQAAVVKMSSTVQKMVKSQWNRIFNLSRAKQHIWSLERAVASLVNDCQFGTVPSTQHCKLLTTVAILIWPPLPAKNGPEKRHLVHLGAEQCFWWKQF